jgi:hypothetical protein
MLMASSPWAGSPPGPQEPPEARSAYSKVRNARVLELVFGVFAVLGALIYALIAGVMYNTDHCFTTGHGSSDCMSYGGAFILGIVILVLGAIGLIAWLLSNPLEIVIAERQYELAKSKMSLWTIIGFFCFVIPGVLLLMARGQLERLSVGQRGGYAAGAPPTMTSPPPSSPWMAPAQAQPPAATPTYTPPPMPTPQAQPEYVAPASTPPAETAPPSPATPQVTPPAATAPAAQAAAPAAAAPTGGGTMAAPPAQPSSPLCAKCGRPTAYIVQYGRYYCYTDQLYV